MLFRIECTNDLCLLLFAAEVEMASLWPLHLNLICMLHIPYKTLRSVGHFALKGFGLEFSCSCNILTEHILTFILRHVVIFIFNIKSTKYKLHFVANLPK
jgi:hypothetical protein